MTNTNSPGRALTAGAMLARLTCMIGLLVAGCAYQGGQINVPSNPDFSRVSRGATAQEVQDALGAPEFIVSHAAGGYEATYKYTTATGPRWMTVIFDREGKVEQRLAAIDAREAQRLADAGREPFMDSSSWGSGEVRDQWFETLAAISLRARDLDPARHERLARFSDMEPGQIEAELNVLAGKMSLPLRVLDPVPGAEGAVPTCCYVEFALPGGVSPISGARIDIDPAGARALRSAGRNVFVRVLVSLTDDWKLVLSSARVHDAGANAPHEIQFQPGENAQSHIPVVTEIPAGSAGQAERASPLFRSSGGGSYEREWGVGGAIGFGYPTGSYGHGILATVGDNDPNGVANLYLAGHLNYRPARWVTLSMVTEWERADVDLLGVDFGRIDTVSLSGEIKLRTTHSEPSAGFIRIGGGWNINMWKENQASCTAWGGCAIEAGGAPLLRVAGGFDFVQDEFETGIEFGWKWNDADVQMNLGGSPVRDDLELSSFYISYRYNQFLEW
ncbi:MAG: hypothetical protein KDH09_11050 [Chrysiogenetes bacterium]|nr:hypothetical protein [Chrysiogenetes bacterium]